MYTGVGVMRAEAEAARGRKRGLRRSWVGMIRWGLYVGKGWVVQRVGVGCERVEVGLSWLGGRVKGGCGLVQVWLGRGRKEPGFGPTLPLP